MSNFEQANVRVTEAVYRFDRALAEAARATEDLAECERALAVHPESSVEESAVAHRGSASASLALAVLRALQFEPIESRPVHAVPTCACEAQWRRTGSAAPWPGSHVMGCPRREPGEMPMAALPSTAAATDLSDCTCAIPAKPPSDHGRNCPVLLRWAAAAGAAGAVIGTTPTLGEVESANALIVSHKMPWCRARLLHALGAAEEQGVLDDVLRELIEDTTRVNNGEQVRYLLRAVLTARKWAR